MIARPTTNSAQSNATGQRYPNGESQNSVASAIMVDLSQLDKGIKLQTLQPAFTNPSQQMPSLFLSSLIEVEFYLSEPFCHKFQRKIQSDYTLRQLTPVITDYFSKMPYPSNYRLEEFKYKFMNEIAPLDTPLKEIFSSSDSAGGFARLDVVFKGKKIVSEFGQMVPENTPALLEQGINPAVQEHLLPRTAKGYLTEPTLVQLARMYAITLIVGPLMHSHPCRGLLSTINTPGLSSLEALMFFAWISIELSCWSTCWLNFQIAS
jgi:hypothetical protein